jgi:hypothetical protein
MRIVQLGRREGKTHRLLDWVAEGTPCTPYPFWTRIIVTPDIHQADWLRDLLRRQAHEDRRDMAYNKVYAYNEWLHAHIGTGWDGEIGIDNLDMLINNLFRHHISIATVTKEDQADVR